MKPVYPETELDSEVAAILENLAGDSRTALRREQRAARVERIATHTSAAGFLSPQALISLTRRERPSAQARVLDRLKLPYRRRPDGSLLVSADVTQSSTSPREPRLRL